MSRRIRANARYAFYKSQMQNQDKHGVVGTPRWRKAHGYTRDEVARMRRKYAREVLASGDGSIVPTPVKSEGYRNRRTRFTIPSDAGDAFDMKYIGTRLRRRMHQKRALMLAEPTDKQAAFLYHSAKKEYEAHVAAVAEVEFAKSIPTAVPAPVETFTAVV